MVLFVLFLLTFSLLATSSGTTNLSPSRDALFSNVVQVQPFPQTQPGAFDSEHEHEIILLSQTLVDSWIKHLQGDSENEPDLSSLYAYVRTAYEEQQQRRMERDGAPTDRRRRSHWCARL